MNNTKSRADSVWWADSGLSECRGQFDPVVASAIFYGVVCWGSSLSTADKKRLNKLKRPAPSWDALGERRVMAELSSVKDYMCCLLEFNGFLMVPSLLLYWCGLLFHYLLCCCKHCKHCIHFHFKKIFLGLLPLFWLDNWRWDRKEGRERGGMTHSKGPTGRIEPGAAVART